jgi:hypothetical protein
VSRSCDLERKSISNAISETSLMVGNFLGILLASTDLIFAEESRVDFAGARLGM